MKEIHIDYFLCQRATSDLSVGELVGRLFDENDRVYVHELGRSYGDRWLLMKHINGYVKAIKANRTYNTMMQSKAESLRKFEVVFYLMIVACFLSLAFVIYLITTTNISFLTGGIMVLSTLLPTMVWCVILKMSNMLRDVITDFPKMKGLEVGRLDIPHDFKVE